MRIYEKPELIVMPVHWAKWPKLAARLATVALSFPWARQVGEEFSTSVSVSIPTSPEAVWKVIENPANAELYLGSIIEVTEREKGAYHVKQAIPAEATPTEMAQAGLKTGQWSVIEYPMEVTEKEELKTHMFRIRHIGGGLEDFGFAIQQTDKNETVLTYSMHTDFAVSNYREIGPGIQQMLTKIAKMAVGGPINGKARYIA